jgi:hypothetical protein
MSAHDLLEEHMHLESSDEKNSPNNKNDKEDPRPTVSPLYQIVLIMISSIILSALFYHREHTFKIQDPLTPYSTINPKSFKEFGGFANDIRVGLYISEFEEFDIVKNSFIFSGQIWFSFAPGIISIDTLQKFSFTSGDILYQSAPVTRLVGDNILVQYTVKVHLKSILNLADFPMDDHTLCIQLQHLYITPNELFFTAQIPDFNIEMSPKVFGWNIVDREAKSGYIELNLDQLDTAQKTVYPTVLFFIDIIRTGMQYTLTLFLPLLLIFFLMLFAFSIQDLGTSISITAGGVTTILAYRFVIVSIAPDVGYFILTDYLFLLFLAISILIFFLSLCDIYYQMITLWAKKIMIASLHIVVTGVTVYLLLA